MKDPSRQPTKLERLEELISQLEANTESEAYTEDRRDIRLWLTWTYNFLSARKLYHKKARLTQAILIKMSKTLLSKDELERVEREAEEQLGNLEDEPAQYALAENDPFDKRNREEIPE